MMQILKFEFLKIFKNKSFIGAGIVLSMSLFAIVYMGLFQSQLTGIKNVTESWGKIEAERNIHLADEYKGELTDQKVKTIISDYLKVYQENRKMEKDNFDYFYWSIVNTFVSGQDIYIDMIDANKTEKEYTIDDVKLNSIKKIGLNKSKFPIIIGNFKTWTELLDVTTKVFMAIALFVILFCSLLFADDSSKNINPLLLSTRFGRTKMIRSKIIVGTGLTIGIFLIVQLMILSLFVYFYGISGWDVSIQANLDWKVFDFPLNWNLLQTYLFSMIFHLTSLLFIAGLTMLVSSLCRSSFSALAISLSIFIIPQALKHLFLTGLLNKVLHLFPINNYEIEKTLQWMNRDNMFFFNSFSTNAVFALMIMIFMKVISDTILYMRMSKLRHV